MFTFLLDVNIGAAISRSLLWSAIFLHVDGLKCLNCRDEGSPQNCRESVVCGTDEICYTREYKDSEQRQAFHLGCEDKERCALFKNPLFGRREVSGVYPAPTGKCYDCCSTENCNVGLCLEALGSHSTTTQTPSTDSFTRCPNHFLDFNDSCYLFAPGRASWTVARDYCREVRAELISVTSKDEHDFLIKEMINLKASYTGNFWTGGFYSHAAGEWEWVDGSHFSYTHWYPGQPPTTLNHTTNYYLAMGNPAYSSSYYSDAPLWVESFGNHSFSVLCKRQNL